MENSDRDLILRVLGNNIKLKRLYDEHVSLEAKLGSFVNKVFLTASEEMETKRLKKRKLLGVDRMMDMLSEHKAA